jgi:hypothetical protein
MVVGSDKVSIRMYEVQTKREKGKKGKKEKTRT